MITREAKNLNGNLFEVFINPRTEGEKRLLGPAIRFTADGRSKTVYAWTFNAGHHCDVSMDLHLNDRFSEPKVLRGAAQLVNGVYRFVVSDFFSSFGRRLTREDREFLTNLFSQDWSWVDPHIVVTEYLGILRDKFGL